MQPTTTPSLFRTGWTWRALAARLRPASPWLLSVVAAGAAGAWLLRQGGEGDARRSDAHAALAVAAAPSPGSNDTPLRSLSGADSRALCLAPVSGGSTAQSALLASMQKAQRLPSRPDVWVDVGHAWMRQLRSTGDSGHALHAEACAKVAQGIDPDDMRALGLVGLVRLDAHEFRAAREVAEAVLARAAEDASALGILSDAALELGDVAAASDAAQRLIDRAPSLGAYARASYLRWLHGNEEGAIELARAAIDAAGDPNELELRAWILVQAAHLFWHRADHEGAEAGYRMALEVRSDYAPALLGLGKVAAGRSEYRRAAELLERALAAHADVETAALLGEVLQRLGDAAGAARNAARAERLGRHDRRALALFYADRRLEPTRAVELARAELGVRADIYTEDALGWALYAKGELAEAEQHVERALRLGTRDARLLYHLGAIRLALGKVGEAKALLEQALRQNPRFDLLGSEQAQRLLARVGS
jgi:tetratricopeptide (TPR) repeat protein